MLGDGGSYLVKGLSLGNLRKFPRRLRGGVVGVCFERRLKAAVKLFPARGEDGFSLSGKGVPGTGECGGDSRIVVPYAPPPSEVVFLVLVRFAYGFLDFLFTYESILTMPLRSTPITGASSLLRADAPWINRSFPTCAARVTPYLHRHVPERRPRFLCSLYSSFTFSFSPSL